MPVEEPQTKATLARLAKSDGGREDRRKRRAIVGEAVALVKVLERDPVPHAREGQESHVPRENCTSEPMTASTCTHITQKQAFVFSTAGNIPSKGK